MRIARKTFAYAERSEKLSPRVHSTPYFSNIHFRSEDRWGRTPLDDAVSGLHDKCSKFLQQQGATRGAGLDPVKALFHKFRNKNNTFL